MKQKIRVILSILMSFTILFSLFSVNVQAATKTITSNETGTFEGYDYEYWKDNGTGTMTLTGGGTFTCSWSNINNILFRTGKKLGSTKTYQDYGNISIDYTCNYQPNGNSYMSVYGWTEDPLVEYYIIDSYGTWNPGSNSTLKGSATIDGRTYQLYQNSRTGPSIKGNTTFQQYWSICTSKRTSGTISVSEHFKAWESKGMKMGKMYEVSMVVEGYQSSGKADMTKMDLKIGGQTSNTPTKAPTPTPTKAPTSTPTKTPTPTYTKIPSTPAISVDLNNDGVVNMADVILLATKFNSIKGDSKFVDAYDLTRDGAINMADVIMIASNFNKSLT
jgi:endo-1,4-beta-xylanase